MWNQRSRCIFGITICMFPYGTLLLLLCEETGLKFYELIGNLGDVHLYKNHLEQLMNNKRESYNLPNFLIFIY